MTCFSGYLGGCAIGSRHLLSIHKAKPELTKLIQQPLRTLR